MRKYWGGDYLVALFKSVDWMKWKYSWKKPKGIKTCNYPDTSKLCCSAGLLDTATCGSYVRPVFLAEGTKTTFSELLISI